MQKDYFLKLSKENILNLAKSQNIFNQDVSGKNMMTSLLNRFDNSFLEDVIRVNPSILNTKDSDGCLIVERLIDAGYFDILEKFVNYIDLTKSCYDEDKNILGYLVSKGGKSVVEKILEKNPTVINVKDPSGVPGTERLADARLFNLLEKFAEYIDLTKNSYDGTKNILSYLISKGGKSVIEKTLEKNPTVINVKDPSGVLGTERLIDAGYFDVLLKLFHYIDLTKSCYDEDKNILGYLVSKGGKSVVEKTLEKDPTIINIKDPSGVPGTERLIDAGYFDVLEKFAEYIDLTKSSYDGTKNMLSYLISKGGKSVVEKTLKKDPTIINVKDPSGVPGTERLVDAGYFDVLENFVNHIDLTKSSYDGTKNMLSYLVSKGGKSVVEKALRKDPTVINVKDPSGVPGTERLIDAGHSSIIKENIEYIDWSKKTYNNQSTLRYLLKKSSINDGIEYIRVASKKHSEIVNQELDLIISNDLIKSFKYSEVSSKINKNKKINDVNLLAFLSNKGLDKYIELLLSPSTHKVDKVIESPVIKSKKNDKEELDLTVILDEIKKSKLLVVDKIKNKEENKNKSQFKSIL